MKRINYCFKKKRLLHSLLHLGLGVLIVISLFPLSIHAQALTSPFLGINFQVTAYGENMSSIVLPKINIESINSTVPSGYISGQLNCTSPSTPTSSNPCDVFSFQNTSGQSGTGNGTRIYLNLQNYLLEANGNATINHQSYFFIDYEFILDDNYKGYVTITDADSNTRTIYVNGNEFHYQRMQLDTSEKAITIDEYELVRVYEPIYWNVPFESVSILYYPLSNNYSYSLYKINNFNFPLFDIKNGSYVTRVHMRSNSTKRFIILINKNIYNLVTLNNNFTFLNTTGNSVTAKNFKQIKVFYGESTFETLIYFELENVSDGLVTISASADMIISPIYESYLSDNNISTDFAETFGLYNYSQASQALDNTNTQFQTDANSLISIEDSFNSTMNSNLDNINPTFNMGSSFLASANWVSTQFNRIVNNTPFASLITFGLTLGLGLLIIGKIRK